MKYSYYLIFIFLTLFIPLAFGGSEPWGLFIFNFICITFSSFVLFKEKVCTITPISKTILYLLGFIIFLAVLQLFNQYNFLQKPLYFPFTLCKYYSFEGLSLLFSLSMLYFALTQIVKQIHEIRNLTLIITINAIIIALVSIFFRVKYIEYFYNIKVFSAFGPFVSRNHGGQFMMISFFLSLFLWLPQFVLNKCKFIAKEQKCYVVSSIILFISIFATHSRGAVIALMSGLFTLSVLFISYLTKKNYKKFIYLTILTLSLILMLYLVIAYSTTLGLRQFGTGSDNARLGLYVAALDMLKDFPYTGVGFDAFSTAIDAYIPFALKAFPRYLHNDWLELLLSFGYIAGTIILWLIFVIIFDITRLFKSLEPKKQIQIFILCAGLTGFVFTGLVDFPFHLPACAVLFFIVLAFVSTNNFTKQVKEKYFPYTLKIILFLLSCIFLWQNFQYTRAWHNFIFAENSNHQIYTDKLNLSLKYYPSPKYIRYVLSSKYKMSENENITAEQRQAIRKEIHNLAEFYLTQYPKDATISRFFVLTKQLN